MDNSIWQMQQQAEQRVRQMQERSRRLVEAQNQRTTATLAAAREAAASPPVSATAASPHRKPLHGHRPPPGRPMPPAVCPTALPKPLPVPAPLPPAAKKTDAEQLFLLLLALFLHRNGANTLLVLAVLYVAL